MQHASSFYSTDCGHLGRTKEVPKPASRGVQDRITST